MIVIKLGIVDVKETYYHVNICFQRALCIFLVIKCRNAYIFQMATHIKMQYKTNSNDGKRFIKVPFSEYVGYCTNM